MKVRQVKKAVSRLRREQRKLYKKDKVLSLSSKIVAIQICLEQLIEAPNKIVFDEFELKFPIDQKVKYKTLKTAFIKDPIKEGFDEIKQKTI